MLVPADKVVRHRCMAIEWAPDFYTDISLPLIMGSSSCLTALVNAIVLQYQLDLDHDISSPVAALVKSIRDLCFEGSIGTDDLIARVEDAIMAECERRNIDKASSDEIMQFLGDINGPLVDDDLELTTGTFNRDSVLLKVFDILNINLRHAWCVDPINAGLSWDEDNSSQDTYAIFTGSILTLRTFDRVQEFINTDSAGDSDIQQRQELIKKWLAANPRSTMSEYGMHKVECGMKAGSVAVIQLGEKYFTMYKHNQDQVFVLLTVKQGIPSRAVWRALPLLISEIDHSFYDGSFVPVVNDTANDEREERIHNDTGVRTADKNTTTDRKRIVKRAATKIKAQKTEPKKSHCTIC